MCSAKGDFATKRATFGTEPDAPHKHGNGESYHLTTRNRHWGIPSMIAFLNVPSKRTPVRRAEERVPFGRQCGRFLPAKPRRTPNRRYSSVHRPYTQIANRPCTKVKKILSCCIFAIAMGIPQTGTHWIKRPFFWFIGEVCTFFASLAKGGQVTFIEGVTTFFHRKVPIMSATLLYHMHGIRGYTHLSDEP